MLKCVLSNTNLAEIQPAILKTYSHEPMSKRAALLRLKPCSPSELNRPHDDY